MLRLYPTYFNDIQILFPVSWNESSNVVENVSTSEAGTDMVSVTRYDKLSVSASYKCTSGWVKMFKTFALLPYITVRMYDIMEEDYVERDMRLRNFTNKLVKKSEDIGGNNTSIAFDPAESYVRGDIVRYGAYYYEFKTAHTGAWSDTDVERIFETNGIWEVSFKLEEI